MLKVSKEVGVFKPNGDLNADDWIRNEVEVRGLSHKDAIKAYNAAVVLYKEPSLLTGKGAISNRWVNWYRVRKRISRASAMLVARNISKNEKSYDKRPTLYP